MTRHCVIVLILGVWTVGCGRKGPPLPPLVRVPAAPADFAAERRGNTVEIHFTVPSANTDKTRPADIERVDVYGYTGPASVSDAELVRRGDRIGAIEVKQPRDPDRTIDPDEPASDLEPLEGDGLNQGVTTTDVFEELSTDALAPASVSAEPVVVEDGLPLLPARCSALPRIYLGVGVSTRGRPGPFSRRAAVPLTEAPSAPSHVSLKYDEVGVTVSWNVAAAAGSSEVLPSRPFACGTPATAYHVYEIGAEQFETRLTKELVTETRFVDRRIEWGAERCYTVRRVSTIEGLSVESEPATPGCVMLADTFPPAPPKGLIVVASQGAINLIWDPNTEKDFAGYRVLRAPASSSTFEPVTPEPIQATNFTDKVDAGTPFIYAIRAVDAAGNESEPSAASAPETAR